MHYVAEAFNLHKLGYFDGTRFTDLEKVVSAEVNEHEVLRAFLGVGQEFLGKLKISLG
jgi:hypothetical protein